MKKVFFVASLLLVCFTSFTQVKIFDVHFSGLKADTVFDSSGKIEKVSALSKESYLDSLFCVYRYHSSGKLKSILFSITVAGADIAIMRYYHKYEYYDSEKLKVDSLGDYRNRMTKEESFTEYFENQKIKRQRIAKGKVTKGRGVAETYSWGTNWTITDKSYNRFGEIIYEEKARSYYR